ncbi:MAG TPA: DUF1360 domain-containing protein [Baekduia sp.]|uniref:DUF1360 domain-containing protein n=1 Tax=Baekduia sp. TaxID=2600305 RepID=UPI002D79BF3A|nr:DUF1360 domain-containing protein [Baekduia sp.]HET6505565.1 DUF1360 domain-containing protein [Baekduia sp.]
MDPVSRTPTKPIDYAALSAGYGALTGALVVAARSTRTTPIRPTEMPALGLATFALAKLVAKEKVDAWVREPFLEERPDGRRRPKGRRLRYAVGELLSCTRCVGTWSALGLVGLRLLRPRDAGVIVPMLALAGANDWLQSGFTTLCAQADTARARAAQDAREAGERETNVRRFPTGAGIRT